ncbi:MAG: potassium channel family protein, partial [Anaerolineae bacterium]
IIALFLATIGVGTMGYRVIEGWQPLDAFYMTIITLTTVGFGELRPLSSAGRLFTVALIIGGMGIVAYASTTAVQWLVSGELKGELLARRRRRMLDRLQHHDIVCGFGRMGQHIAAELARRGSPFVVIDRNAETVARCRQLGHHCVLGNAAEEATLHKAGIMRARSLIAAVNSDAGNVFIILTARALRSDLIIVARVNYDSAESKLRRAGANEVISPYLIGGRRMVHYVDRPGVVDFLDVVMHSPELELWIEEFNVRPDSPLAGKSLRQAQLRSTVGVNVLSVRCPGKPLSTHPDADTVLNVGTRLIVLGTRQQLSSLATLITPAGPEGAGRP